MIDSKVLEKFGSTDERLREVFTASRPSNYQELPEDKRKAIDAELERRKRWQDRISGRIDMHVPRSLQDYSLFAAIDMAWDSPPITKEIVPLLQYAQGRISLPQCAASLKNLNCAQDYVREKDGKIVDFEMPAFFEFNINLLRSVITRRHSAQMNKYRNLYPCYRYEARTTTQVGRLKADAMSQVAEIIVDAYDYRGHDEQVNRDTLLYTTVFDFVKAKWDRQLQMRPVQGQTADTKAADLRVESFVAKEGLDWVIAHPTRTFYDFACPARLFNSDTVPVGTYLGYWDVQRLGTISHNPSFWNRDSLSYTTNWIDLFSTHANYWSQYYKTITIPPIERIVTVNDNDRQRNVGLYAGLPEDTSAMVAVYFEKVVPADEGFGNYPYPVWVRFITAGAGGTVVYAEFLPSSPAAVSSLNAKDDRQLNISMAMQLLPYQDALTNLFTHMIALCKIEQMLGFGCDTDLIPDPVMQKQLKEFIEGKRWYSHNFFVKFSGSQSKVLGVDSSSQDGPIKIWQAKPRPDTIQHTFEAIIQLLQFVERLEAISPNETGQPIVRGNGGVSATEASQIGQTSNTVFNFISDSHDAFREAKKRILFESWMCSAEEQFRVPVVNRYPPSTVEAAGLRPFTDDDPQTTIGELSEWTVMGNKYALWYDFFFSSRDGAERPVNTQSANTLVSLLPVIVQNPDVLRNMGKTKFFAILNEIFRQSGAAVDLNLELKPGESDDIGGQDQVQELSGLLTQLAKQVQQQQGGMQQLQQNVDQLAQVLNQRLDEVGASVQDTHEKTRQMMGDMGEGMSMALERKAMSDELKRQKLVATIKTKAPKTNGGMGG